MNATRYNTRKCKACGSFTSALVTAEEFRAIQMRAAFPKTQPRASSALYTHASGSLVIDCRGCGKALYAFEVRGKFSAKHECSAKCLESHGFLCECSCGGKNHGAAHSAA